MHVVLIEDRETEWAMGIVGPFETQEAAIDWANKQPQIFTDPGRASQRLTDKWSQPRHVKYYVIEAIKP